MSSMTLSLRVRPKACKGRELLDLGELSSWRPLSGIVKVGMFVKF